MAEQTSHDVVNQTRSGGEPSSSDVPASKKDKYTAEGGEGRITKIEFNFEGKSSNMEQSQRNTRTTDTSEAENSSGEGSKDTGRNGSAAVATRALELNGVASMSDGGEDGGSLGGSDTDTSRNDGRQHLRTSSMKKPTAFKPVSFAKFSVPKAPGTSAAPKLDADATLATLSVTPLSASPQPSTRPRLVAKTTSGLGSSSKHTAAGLKGPSSGPDASQVWNKNRPAQPPPTKHLTDEELKQQYGIHMTSRIQEDGNGTESKWADIDDDEDDWAPETIEWNDGTKIKLTHTENSQSSPQEIRDRTDAKEAAIPAQLPAQDSTKVLYPKTSTTVGPNATVLRLGANAERQQQQAKAVIASKSGSDKPTLTTKSPAPVPMKSPWAPLPPVEKVSPVNPPVQTVQSHHAPRFQAREQAIPDKNIPAREIAADDFNRSWREGQSNVPRELFNSQSGRYEPVPDTRKGSVRDAHMRPATVLQRPGNHEVGSHPEPSAAFQTYRSSHQEPGHWGRRRASSNVSGGSGSYGRRMSIGRPDSQVKFNEGRRGSQVNGVVENSVSPSETIHSKDFMPPEHSAHQPSSNQTWQPKMSTYTPPGTQPGGKPMTSDEVNRDSNQASAEDVILMQQRIMKEKRLEARQRRLEQEQKEEAARRERIRLKLEALGPAPGKEKETPKVEERPEATTALSKGFPKDQLATTGAQNTVQSPPKPPVPEPSGEPKQYGMMRVHHPESVKKLVAANERATEKPSTTSMMSQRSISPSRDVKHETVKTNGVLQDESLLSKDQNIDMPTLEEKDSQWRGNQTSYTPWGAGTKLSAHSSPSSNMWKPLSSDKTLGNGTFDRNLAAFSHDLSLRGPVGLTEPPPIGSLPNMDKNAGSQPFVGARLAPEHKQSLAQSDSTHAPYEPFQPIGRPRPIGPPNSQHSPWQADARRTVQAATSAWGNFHSVASKQEAEANAKFHREFEAMRDEPPASLNVTFSETWRQVRSGDQVGQREVIDVVKATKATGPLQALHGFDAPIDSLPFPEAHPRPFSGVPNRGSRFFPTITEPYRVSVAVDDGRPRSPSPPPPEAYSTHPAYSGDAHRPLVNLPIPKPIVRLPPKISQLPPKPPTFASMAATQLRPPQPVMSATSWQDRINGLFGKATPEKKHILAVASATKEPLDVQSHLHPAAVSFPQTRGVGAKNAELVTSKEVEEEEAIFEDREAGSLPVVRVPVMAPPNAWHAALPPPARLRPKVLRPMQVHSVEPFALEFPKKDVSGNWQIVVHIPGCDNVASVALLKKLFLTSSRPKGNTTFRTRKSAKPREPGAKYNGSHNNKRQGSSSDTTRSGEGNSHASGN
ncbi:conserved hypothetical protein [Talaromyces stipitatus ATCC 10500]|uniref:Uncharacterized protein n=1 Tax=Talaromyces stipitatus (strain ATCC 10500 / CBS 375.48 / QM 6759 / NRRL 1006) TaxID=441959 RepID=B8M2R1_TALSN|nr:uncharacterized protein TSTA_092140 [Talaromyces stipitatus ATCC 10500]EED21972.1 conserved hypothetical protein [Talaromyces stipitatus ATCC 10500]